jgi:alkaline phosphatase D
MAGEKRLGAVLYEVNGTALEPSIVDVPGLETYWLDDVIDEVYPPSPAKSPAPG